MSSIRSPGSLIALLAAIALGAVALDLAAIWTWRYLRRVGRSGLKLSRPQGLDRIPHRLAAITDSIQQAARRGMAACKDLLRSGVRELRSSEWTVFRSFVVIACLATTASFGYLYVDDVFVRGWQLWAYAVCTLVAGAALLPSVRFPLRPNRSHLWLVGLFLIAFGLRAFRLGSLPAGLHVDEAGAADFTLRHVLPPQPNTISPFRTGPSAQPALYYYLARASLAIFGENNFGLRFTSALAGALGVLATYALISALTNRRAALMGAAIMATSHFDIHWSRIGLNNIWDSLWVPLVLALFAWGWKNKWSGGAVVAGLALGLSSYFYAGSRIAIPLLALLAVQLWRADRDSVRMLVHSSKLAAGALVAAAPLLVFSLLQPDLVLERLYGSLIWKPAGFGPAPTPTELIPSIWDQLVRSVYSFTSLAENSGFYRPGVPLVIGLAVPLLIAGGLWAIYKRQLLPVVWLGLTAFLGGFLLQALPASNHYVVAIPAIAWLIALSLDQLSAFGGHRLALAALAIVIATDLYFYFGIYAMGPTGDLVLPFPPNPWG